MSSSSLIRVQQSSFIDRNNSFNKKSTISMFRLIFHLFNYIYLLNTRICVYFLLLIKRLLRFLFGFWSFIFVTLHGSKEKVRK
jgi:hypothetical protein